MKRSFGKYELLERIGHGGMAEVFRARSVGARGIEKTLVIKRILPELSTNPRFVEMFIAEAQIAMGLNHPNIVQVYDFGRVGEDYFLAMEYVDGFELARLMSAARRVGQRIPMGAAVFLAMEAARGLDYAHRRVDAYGRSLELVHRDVSPQNLMVSRDGALKIVDFGIAKATSVAEDMPGIVKGKLQYMSPEQAIGEPVDQRSDLFSLGAVLFEMVCGRALFAGADEEETLNLVSSAVVPQIAMLNGDVPEQLERVIYKSLARARDERYQSAREFQVELTRILYGLEEIHDATTLSATIRDIEELLPEQSLEFSIDEGAELRTVRTRAARTANSGGTPQLGLRTPSLNETTLQLSLSRQRKEVVILTGRVSGLDEHAGEEGGAMLLDDYERIVDGIAFKSDAAVHRLERAGFTLLLGIPLSSESDAERATRMARDLVDAIEGMRSGLLPPLSAQVAVNVGEVILEHGMQAAGRQYRWESRGPAWALAETFVETAPTGGVLVGEQVFHRIRRGFHCRPMGEGAYQVIRAMTPRDHLEELRRSSESFHGRELMRRLLREGFRQALLKERARAVILMGPAGVGKSALVEKFLGGLNPREVRIVRGVASPYDADAPLASAVSLFSEFMRLDLREGPDELREKIAGPILALFPDESEEELDWLQSSLYHLFGISMPGSLFEDLSGEERRRRLFLTLSRLVNRYASGKPVVFAIDDVHYIDPVMRAFAAQYFDRTQKAPVFFVGTARDTGAHLESRSWRALITARNLKVEELRELSEAEARALIRFHLPEHRADEEELVDALAKQAGGNPLYIREVVAGVDNEGYDPGSLPASLEGLVAARLDRLTLAERTTLQKVSLLRTPFSHGEAAGMLEADEENLLDELVESGVLIAEAEAGQERTYRFATGLMREVAERALLPAEARRLHLRIAEHLQEAGGRYDVALAARHLDDADEGERAVAMYVQALSGSYDNFGASETLRICRRILSHEKTNEEQRFEALMWKERAQGVLGEVEDVEETLRELQDLVERFGDESQRSHVQIRRARYLISRGRFEEARGAAETALEIATTAKDRLSMARAWRTEASIDLTEGQRDRSLSLVDRAIATLSMRTGPEVQEEIVRCYNLRGVVLRQSGRHREALEAYETALAGAEALDSGVLTRQLLNNSGLALAFVGEFSEAKRRYERALDAARRLGHRRDEALLLVNLGHVSQMVGDTERAIPFIRRGIYLAQRTMDRTTVVDGKVSLGLAYLEAADLDEAERILEDALIKAVSIPHLYLTICAILGLAQVHLGRDTAEDAERALWRAQEALQRSEEGGMRWAVAISNEVMARALDLLGHEDEARERARQAVAVLDEVEIYGVDQVLVTYAELLSEDDEDERERIIRRALEVYKTRRENIDDPGLRRLYDRRDINQRIRRLAMSRELVERSSAEESPQG